MTNYFFPEIFRNKLSKLDILTIIFDSFVLPFESFDVDVKLFFDERIFSISFV